MGSVFAAVDIPTAAKSIDAFKNFGDVVTVVVRNSFVLAGVISFILLIFGGFGVIVGAGGDAKKMEGAKQTVTMAAAGVLLVVGAYWIVQAIGLITGSNLLAPPGL